MKYRMIERCRDAFPIRMMCRHLNISSSGYYEWRGRSPSQQALANQNAGEDQSIASRK